MASPLQFTNGMHIEIGEHADSKNPNKFPATLTDKEGNIYQGTATIEPDPTPHNTKEMRWQTRVEFPGVIDPAIRDPNDQGKPVHGTISSSGEDIKWGDDKLGVVSGPSENSHGPLGVVSGPSENSHGPAVPSQASRPNYGGLFQQFKEKSEPQAGQGAHAASQGAKGNEAAEFFGTNKSSTTQGTKGNEAAEFFGTHKSSAAPRRHAPQP
jgi:hypothetical protein